MIRWQYFYKIFSSELLRKDGSSPLLSNFLRFLKLKKSEHDDRQQDLYTAVLCRPVRAKYDRDDNIITLTRIDNTEVKVTPDHPLLACVRQSRIPIRNIKTIKAELSEVKDWTWEVFNLLTSGGAVIEEIHCTDRADYSPVIHEIIQQGKLLNLR